MKDVIAALIPPVVVLGFFVALLITSLRATDRPKRRPAAKDAGHDGGPGERRPPAGRSNRTPPHDVT